MKRPNRQIEIFNLSMLDVITGAIGAIMLVLIVLLTQKLGEEAMSCQDIKEELITTRTSLTETTRELIRTKNELAIKKIDTHTAVKDISTLSKVLDTTADKFKWTINKISQIQKEMFASSPDDNLVAFKIPRKIVMVIDLSGSMAPASNKYNEDRLSQVKAALKMFIAGMDQEYWIDIVYFPAFEENIDKKIYPDFKIKPFPDKKCKEYEMRDEAYDNMDINCYKYGYFEGKLKQILTENDKYNFYKKIACLRAYHDTPTKTALDFILTDDIYKEAEGIILFSDGQPDSIRKKYSTKDDLLKSIKNKNKSNKKIFSVGVGAEFRNQEDTIAVDFLKELAKQNGGFYIGF